MASNKLKFIWLVSRVFGWSECLKEVWCFTFSCCWNSTVPKRVYISQQIRLYVAHVLSCLDSRTVWCKTKQFLNSNNSARHFNSELPDSKTKILLIDCSLFYASAFMICLKVQTSNCEAWKCIVMSLTTHIECHLIKLFM